MPTGRALRAYLDFPSHIPKTPPTMAEPKENVLMEKIVSLCKRRGFIYQSSEIYGGINGFWDYGPMGAELKRNVKELWWNAMTRQRDDVVGLEATIIMSPEIWKASGHVETFSDPMCDCLLTKKRFRADQVEPQSGIVYFYRGARDRAAWPLINKYPPEMRKPVEDKIEDYFGPVLEISGKTDVDQLVASMATHASEFKTEYQQEGLPGLQELSKEFLEYRRTEREESFSVLVPKGKPPESARKIAKQFYQMRGVEEPELLGERSEQINDTTRYNPENGSLLTPPVPFNLMFKTYVGPTATEADVAYLRPETAQAIFAQFKNVLDTARQKVPFGIGQIGKAFRNEVTPRNYTFRSREFEQMELEFFIKPDEVVEAICGSVATVPETGHPGAPQPNWGWQAWHQYWVEERVRFYEGIGLTRDTLGFHRQTAEELAHYARACVDILFKFPFSKKDAAGNVTGDELEGIAARSDFDLSQHQRFSGKPMGVFDEELRAAWGKLPKEKQDDLWRRYYENRKRYLTKMGTEAEAASKQATEDANGLAKGQYIPHVIEPSAGVDRLILALLANAFAEETKADEKGKSETTVVMKFHPRVAPYKAGIFPLLKNKPELVKKAQEVRALLRPWMNVFYDEAGSIGRRYARQDEAGTPYCVTIDFDTLGEKPELKDTVTLRHRDDGRQERLPIGELRDWLLARVR